MGGRQAEGERTMHSDPTSAGDPHLKQCRPLVDLLRSVRRRALLLLATQSLVHALIVGAALGGILAAVGRALGVSWSLIGWSVLAAVLAVGTWFMHRRVMRRTAFLHAVDDRYDAAGRLVVAAEFLACDRPLDAYQRLALGDAARWIESRRTTRLPWTWPSRWPTASSCLLLFILIVSGCQKPTLATNEHTGTTGGSISVAPPDGGSTTPPGRPPPPAPASSTENPFGRPAPRPDGVTYGADEFPSDRGGGNKSGGNASGTQGRGSGMARGGTGAQNQAPNKPGGQGATGGSGAGTSGGPKQADPRGVQAARKDVEASGGKGVGKPSGPERVGKGSKPGEEFASGGARGATTRPAAIVGFDGVEIDEMTLERLPPEQRERIRQYNENLRKLREQQASAGGTPTTAPAGR